MKPIQERKAMKKRGIGLFVAILIFGMVSSTHADVIDLYSVADAEITGYSQGSFANTHNWGDLLYLTGHINRTGGPTSAQFPNSGDSRGLFEFESSP